MSGILILKICVVFLSISNIGLLVVMSKINDKVNLHQTFISEILVGLCEVLGKKEEE